jgi:hypothetical protein
VAPPQLDAESDFNSDDSAGSQFDAWDERFEADEEAKAAEEMAQWGKEQQVHGDLEQAAVLASYNTQRFRRLDDEELECINNANYKHAIEITRQRVATEEAGCLLMTAEWQKLLELNA